ncbi:FecR family protein [Sphingobacterium faecale]|uniref:FecR domain-containing protein n=1 Tax=Sphingobacterium faecale TaxID=2803775 RepID=A0ABS1R444_9SPHI|nr:FecR domain-containing protein [Sphingobacterium faecale]MBL1409472.1 FecR domain-containing protein [Sphingobacterium faecale]
MEKDYFDKLIEQYSKNELGKEKRKIMDDWFEGIQHPSGGELWTDEERKNIKAMILSEVKPVKTFVPLWKKVAVAASVLLVGTAVLWIYQQKNMEIDSVSPLVTTDTIKPGEDKGILYHASQEQVQLNNLRKDSVYVFGGIAIERIADNEVRVMPGADGGTEIQHIHAPRGGNFIVQLEDGSRLTLNANSSISFPSSFDGRLREVSTSGEVFFEVEKDRYKRPFIVNAGSSTIKVLGTKFNVNFKEGEFLRTALFEGSVQVSNKGFEVRLAPGEELCVDAKGKYTVREFESERVGAWKEGYFALDNKNIEEIMEEVADWYNVEVSYADVNLDIRYQGSISKFSDIHTVLEILALAKGNTFEIKGRRIMVK